MCWPGILRGGRWLRPWRLRRWRGLSRGPCGPQEASSSPVQWRHDGFSCRGVGTPQWCLCPERQCRLLAEGSLEPEVEGPGRGTRPVSKVPPPQQARSWALHACEAAPPAGLPHLLAALRFHPKALWAPRTCGAGWRRTSRWRKSVCGAPISRPKPPLSVVPQGMWRKSHAAHLRGMNSKAAAQLWWNNIYSGNLKGPSWVWPWSFLALSSFVSDNWTEKLSKRSKSKLSPYSYLLLFDRGLRDCTSDTVEWTDLGPLFLGNCGGTSFSVSCLDH